MNTLDFEAIVRVDSNIAYASSSAFNGLFKVEIDTGKCSFVKLFPDEKVNKTHLHTKAILSEDRLFFIPGAAENLAILNLNNMEIENIRIKEVENASFYDSYYKFTDGIIWSQCLFLLCSTYPAIVRYDIRNNQVAYFDEWIPVGKYMFRKALVLDEGVIYAPNLYDNSVLMFDLKICKGKILRIGEKNHGGWSMCKYKHDLWIAPKKPGAVIQWNPLTGNIIEHDEYPFEFVSKDFSFTRIFEYNDELILMPAFANMFVKISPNTGEMQECKIPCLRRNTGALAYLFEMDNKYFVRENCLEKGEINIRRYWLDINKLEIAPHEFYFFEGKKRFLEECVKENEMTNVFYEKPQVSLKDFILEIVNGMGMRIGNNNQNVGERIYKRLF